MLIAVRSKDNGGAQIPQRFQRNYQLDGMDKMFAGFVSNRAVISRAYHTPYLQMQTPDMVWCALFVCQ